MLIGVAPDPDGALHGTLVSTTDPLNSGFIAAASRAPLYYDLLQTPNQVAELERQLRVDVLVNIQQERVARAGFNGSGVSRNNRILERRPDLAKVLCEDFYRSCSGEVSPGDLPYIKQPIFSFADGYFSATGMGAVIDKAQHLPGVPKFTPAQKEKAVADYTRAIELNRREPVYWSNRGSAYAELGQHDKAAADFAKAIELNAATRPH